MQTIYNETHNHNRQVDKPAPDANLSSLTLQPSPLNFPPIKQYLYP